MRISDWSSDVCSSDLDRLGLANEIAERLPVELVLPQVGQAALAVECRVDDRELLERLAAVDHLPTHRCVAAERAFLAELGGDCSLPACRSEEHTSELQSLMRTSYAVFCLKTKTTNIRAQRRMLISD